MTRSSVSRWPNRAWKSIKATRQTNPANTAWAMKKTIELLSRAPSRNPDPIRTAPTMAGKRGPLRSWIRPATTITRAKVRMQIEKAYFR